MSHKITILSLSWMWASWLKMCSNNLKISIRRPFICLMKCGCVRNNSEYFPEGRFKSRCAAHQALFDEGQQLRRLEEERGRLQRRLFAYFESETRKLSLSDALKVFKTHRRELQAQVALLQ